MRTLWRMIAGDAGNFTIVTLLLAAEILLTGIM